MNQDYQILLFYKYVHLSDPEAVRAWLQMLCEKHGLKGRLIVASEGLNITLEGEKAETEAFIEDLETDSRFGAIHFKRSLGNGHAFRKLSVRVRPEIVTTKLGVCDVDPNQITGKRLSPEMLHQWFAESKEGKKEFFIVDMRNIYEHDVGHFEDSYCPPMENFRDLAEITKHIGHLKNKTVLTVCTGGVRCEKASGYLISQGFADVWQLDGGIVSYMEKYPNEHFLGKLYVFDKRVAMGFYTDDPAHVVIGACKACKGASERFVNCGNVWCGKHFILCEQCESSAGNACPDGCKVRRAYKVKSPVHRAVLGARKLTETVWKNIKKNK
jgi:UPF0176 protein